MPAPDARLHSPAAERNTAPILAQLQALLPAQGLMLEIASGSGRHAAAFSTGLPGWEWQPTDFEASALDSIRAWCQGLDRVRAPVQLDVLSKPWPAQLPSVVDAMFCANMIHIAPWACTDALMQGAACHLGPHGLLITYGPYLEEATPTAPGNLAFDADLRSRNPAWGVRQLSEVESVAGQAGLRLRQRISMPANNLLLVWART
ncbi:DUF938 domain-containing protein [Curvibacter gracilis]|uniref:DUF938 domain-containing protein n=1 Tax=Curvibacter gracilis TaxID=230310 RepID=UPI0004844663|nr:DUF938 domain-containing protein [Curvibacter gracilis]